jgi:secreted trypsin-like serine protease
MRMNTMVMGLAAVIGLGGCAGSTEEGTEEQASASLSNPDHTHTGVGALVFRRSNGELWNVCSGAMISPTIMVTAAHCTEAMKYYASLPREIGVTFDQTITASTQIIPAVPVSSPSYSPAAYNINSDTNDIGLMVLAQPVSVPTYPLAPRGTFSGGKVKAGSPITQVGYGVDQNGESGVPGQTSTNDMTRDYGVVKFRSATAYIMADQVQGDGMCFGDSGGPAFMNVGGKETIVGVGVVINGYDCNQVEWSYRVDGDATRAFLGQYVTLP